MQTLQEERRRLAFEAAEGDADAATRLEELEAELRVAEIEAERAKLAEQEKARRNEQERRKQEEAERQRARSDLRRHAAQRLKAAEKIESALDELVAGIADFMTTTDAARSLLRAAGIEQKPGFRVTLDVHPASVFILSSLFASALPKPLPRPIGAPSGSLVEQTAREHETLQLDDQEGR